MGNTTGCIRPCKGISEEPQILWDTVTVQELSQLGASVQFNKTQCRKLISKLSEAVKEILIEDPSNRYEIDFNPLIKDFNRVFMKAKALVEENTRTDWFTVAINMDSKEAFKELLLEVRISYISVCNYMERRPSLTFDPATPEEISDDLNSLEDCITQGLKDSNRERQAQARFLKYKLDFLRTVGTIDISEYGWSSPSGFGTEFLSSPRRVLSSGAFGGVSKVKWMGRICAVKEYVNGDDFRKEASILATLSHPNIIKFLDYGRDENEGNFLIMMELGHRDLQDSCMRSGSKAGPPFLLPYAFDIIFQIARGMRYLHTKQIVHFDLKPSNVILTDEPNHGYFTVKIIDFVLSKKIEKGTGNFTEKNYGTVKFMAPEIFKVWEIETSNMVVDPFKSDVYSFAMTCFVILSGRMPFEETVGRRDILKLIRTKSSLWKPLESEYLERLSGLKDLIEQCHALNPADRPTFESICSTLADLKIGFLTGGDFRSFKSRVSEEPGEDVPSSSMQ